MPSLVLTDTVASITELKANPISLLHQAGGHSFAILNRNEPAFYCVPPKVYEYLMELADDAELARIVEERQNEESYPADWGNLLNQIYEL